MNAPTSNEKHGTSWAHTYARLKPELDALPAAEVRSINTNIVETIETVVGSLPRLRALGPTLTNTLPRFDQRLFDKLEECAHALATAHARFLAAPTRSGETDEVLERATKLRRTLMSDAAALCTRGYLSKSQLSKVKGRNGYVSTSEDLGWLVGMLGEVLPRVQGKSAVTSAELELATELLSQLWQAEGIRKGGPSLAAQASDDRNRAFTLLAKTYAEVRPAIVYVRAAEGDAAAVMPQLLGRPRSSDQARASKRKSAPK